MLSYLADVVTEQLRKPFEWSELRLVGVEPHRPPPLLGVRE
jgi:hypothetical protein